MCDRVKQFMGTFFDQLHKKQALLDIMSIDKVSKKSENFALGEVLLGKNTAWGLHALVSA